MNEQMNDTDQQFTELGMINNMEFNWNALRRIIVEYFAILFVWVACIFCIEPDCGVPMRSWVVYYLFFRLFKSSHNAIGILLILNETPIYYKPYAKMLIFTIFEQFEFWWMVSGEYIFFFAPQNNCKIQAIKVFRETETMTQMEQQKM
jgi:hypothetical protein